MEYEPQTQLVEITEPGTEPEIDPIVFTITPEIVESVWTPTSERATA